MGSLHDAVMQYVEREMKKDPGVKNATLFAGAARSTSRSGSLGRNSSTPSIGCR